MERILVIGCPGAGKSTLSRQLGEKLGLPVIHLDRLFWKPGWVESTREEFDARLLAQLEHPRWIIDGNYTRTYPQRLAKCDMVIHLDFNRFACLWGVISRVLKNYGQVRPDMPEGCPERFDWEFLKWVWNFNRTHRPRNLAALEAAEGITVITLKNRRQGQEFLRQL